MASEIETTRKLYMTFTDRDGKDVTITFKHLDDYSVELEEACRVLASSFYTNRNCLKIDISGGVKQIDFASETMHIIYSRRDNIGEIEYYS